MKVVILGDLHMGARSGDLDFAHYFNKFFTEVLYPYMHDEGIDTIIQLGDYFDNQTSVDTAAWKACRPIWVDQLVENNFRMVMLVGNHDIAFRNTLRVNTPELILSGIENIQVLRKPTSIYLDDSGYGFDIVPWICNENRDEILSFIQKQENPVLLGHFAIEGFPMYKGGVVDKKGLSKKIFENYPFVFSGHFHTRSQFANIEYTGTPYEITWADYGDQKGFFVFDTGNQVATFVENPLTMFEKIVYNDGCDYDLDWLEGKIVKLVVTNRGNIKKYNSFLDKLGQIKLKELVIQEQVNDTSEVANVESTEVDWIDDKVVYIKRAVEAAITDLDKETVIDYLSSLHDRSMVV